MTVTAHQLYMSLDLGLYLFMVIFCFSVHVTQCESVSLFMITFCAPQAGAALSDPATADFFARAIMACVPKSYAQALGEVKVTAAFLNNFAGDNVRRLAKSFGVPGDHYGQMSVGHRWPYGPCAIISPFNFPLEIPSLQLMGALYMGNKPVLKPSEQVAVSLDC